MLGLTLEKLFVVAIVAGVVIGPQRMPVYARQIGETIRAMRRMLDAARHDAEVEMGMSMQRREWESMDLRQYHPRRLVRDALAAQAPLDAPVVTATDEIAEQASRVRPGQKYLVMGDAAHPRRVLIDSLALDDPRRIAAELETRLIDHGCSGQSCLG